MYSLIGCSCMQYNGARLSRIPLMCNLLVHVQYLSSQHAIWLTADKSHNVSSQHATWLTADKSQVHVQYFSSYHYNIISIQSIHDKKRTMNVRKYMLSC